jgi:hypothetical protein
MLEYLHQNQLLHLDAPSLQGWTGSSDPISWLRLALYLREVQKVALRESYGLGLVNYRP